MLAIYLISILYEFDGRLAARQLVNSWLPDI